MFLIHSSSYNKKCGHSESEIVRKEIAEKEKIVDKEISDVLEKDKDEGENLDNDDSNEDVSELEEIDNLNEPDIMDEQQDSNISLSKIILESVINQTDGSKNISLEPNELSEETIQQIDDEKKTELSLGSELSTTNENCDDTTKYERGRDPIKFQKGANDGNIYVYSLGNCDLIEVCRETQKAYYCGLHAVNNMLGQNMTEFLQEVLTHLLNLIILLQKLISYKNKLIHKIYLYRYTKKI